MKYTLKLDASYRPLEVIDSFKAASMVLSGRAKSLEDYPELVHPTLHYPLVIVLKKYIRKHQFAKSCNRLNVIWRDNHTCQYCAKQFSYNELTMDHVIPKSKGGHKVWTNIVASCKACNSKKGNYLLSETNLKLLKKPKVPKVNFTDLKHPCEIKKEWKKYI